MPVNYSVNYDSLNFLIISFWIKHSCRLKEQCLLKFAYVFTCCPFFLCVMNVMVWTLKIMLTVSQ